MPTLKPRAARVVLKRVDERELTYRGVVLATPETLTDRPVEAVVVEAGPECKYVKQGDKVLLNRYSSSDFEFYGEKICIADEREILGVIRCPS